MSGQIRGSARDQVSDVAVDTAYECQTQRGCSNHHRSRRCVFRQVKGPQFEEPLIRSFWPDTIEGARARHFAFTAA